MGAMSCGCSLPAICTTIQYKKIKTTTRKEREKNREIVEKYAPP